MSWEDEDFDPSALLESIGAVSVTSAAPAKAAPADDEEDLTVLESLAPPAPAPAPAGPAQPETIKAKHIKKDMARKEIEEARRRLEEEGVPLDDPRLEELRRRALQEKADLELAADSLTIKGFDDHTLVGLMSFVEPDAFEKNAVQVAKKVLGASGMKHTNAVKFFKHLLEFAGETLTADELKDIAKVATSAANKKEKKTAAAPAPKPAAKKAKAAKVFVGRDDDYGYGDDYDDADEFADVGSSNAVASNEPAVDQPASTEVASFDFM